MSKSKFSKSFSDKAIKNLRPESKPYVWNEGRGFSIQVYPSGIKTFLIRYSFNSKQKQHTLGQYISKSQDDTTSTPGYLTLAEARTSYNNCIEMLKRGEDPAAPKIVEQEIIVQPQSDTTTLGGILESFLEWSENNHCKKWSRDSKYTLNKHVPDAWKAKPIVDIKRIDCIELMESIEKCGKGAARNAQKVIRGLFSYAEERRYIDISPFVRLSRAVPALKPVSRKRYLTETEIKKVWEVLTDGAEELPSKRAILLILVTGQRPAECAGLLSSDIEEEGSGDTWWTVPPQRNKKERYHRIYLTETAKKLIGETKGAVFPGADGIKSIERVTLSHYISDREYFGLPRWTPHDLRRSVRTHMPRIGVLKEHAEAVVNHAKEGMDAIYNLYQYDKEKKEALLKWETELLKIVSAKQLPATDSDK